MTPKFTEKEWLEDFKDFVQHGEAKVPDALSQKILGFVRRDLHPSCFLVFAKLLAIHSIVGTLSLFICDQFGMSPFNSGFSLSEYFMRFGHSACMTLCGFLFLSLSVVFAWFVLRPEELRVVWKNVWIQIPSIALLSLVAFILFGSEILFGIGVLWFFGAVTGGFFTVYLIARPTS